MSTADLLPALALVLLVLGSLLASADAALSRVSRVRAEELLAEGHRGATSLRRVAEEPSRYLNLVVLLRVTCEMGAAVLVAGVTLRFFDTPLPAFAVAA